MPFLGVCILSAVCWICLFNDNMATLNVSILKSKSNDQNAKEQYITVDIDHDVKLPEDSSVMNRRKRMSLPSIVLEGDVHRATSYGTVALQNILKGARKVWAANFNRLYEKHGGYKTAVKDFKAADPRGVRKVPMKNGDSALEGRVGDLKLLLYMKDSTVTMDILHLGEISQYAKSRGWKVSQIKDTIKYID